MKVITVLKIIIIIKYRKRRKPFLWATLRKRARATTVCLFSLYSLSKPTHDTDANSGQRRVVLIVFPLYSSLKIFKRSAHRYCCRRRVLGVRRERTDDDDDGSECYTMDEKTKNAGNGKRLHANNTRTDSCGGLTGKVASATVERRRDGERRVPSHADRARPSAVRAYPAPPREGVFRPCHSSAASIAAVVRPRLAAAR